MMKQLAEFLRRAVPLLLMLFVFSLSGMAQGIQISGTVVDNAGDPLIGASVIVKGQTTVGTVTDIDGNFELKVPSEQSVLVISYVGMTTKEVKVGKQRSFRVSLGEDAQLEEVFSEVDTEE